MTDEPARPDPPLYLCHEFAAVPLLGREGRLGRLPGLAVTVVPSPLVSAVHASWRRVAADAIQVRDLGSANGTFVDGVRIGREWVRLGLGGTLDLGTGAPMTLVGPSEQPSTASASALRMSFQGAGERVRVQVFRGPVRVALVEGRTAVLLRELARRRLEDRAGEGWVRKASLRRALYPEEGIPEDPEARRLARGRAASALDKAIHDARKRLAELEIAPDPIETRPLQVRLATSPAGLDLA